MSSRAARLLASTALAITAVLLPAHALASGYELPVVGSGASSPLTPEATSVATNPAALAYLERGQVAMGGFLVTGQLGYTRNYLGTYQVEDGLDFQAPLDDSQIDPTKRGEAARVVGRPLAPAAYLFVAAPIVRDRLTIGGGLYVPYAAQLALPRNGPQRFQVQEALFATTKLEVALAARVHDKVSFGAGVAYAFTLLELAKVQDFAALDLFGEALARPPLAQANDFGSDAPSTARELDVLARPVWIQRAFGHAVTFDVGMFVRATPRVDLALTYHHDIPVVARGAFTLDMNDDFFTQDLAAQGLRYPKTVRGDATIRFRFPSRLVLGVGVVLDRKARFRLDTWGAWVRWSLLKAFDITLRSADLAQPELGLGPTAKAALPREFVDTMQLRTALRAQVHERVGLNVGLGVDTSAAPDRTIDVASPDGLRLSYLAGVVARVSKRVEFLGDVTVQHILPRDVTTSRHDLANGRYTLVIAAIGLHLRVAFGGPGVTPKRGGRPAKTPTSGGQSAPSGANESASPPSSEEPAERPDTDEPTPPTTAPSPPPPPPPPPPKRSSASGVKTP